MEIRSRHESRLVELDSGRRRDFDSQLAEAMQQLRKDHESQVQQYKDEIDRSFASKVKAEIEMNFKCPDLLHIKLVLRVSMYF